MQSTNTILDDLYDAWRNQDLTWFASYPLRIFRT